MAKKADSRLYHPNSERGKKNKEPLEALEQTFNGHLNGFYLKRLVMSLPGRMFKGHSHEDDL